MCVLFSRDGTLIETCSFEIWEGIELRRISEAPIEVSKFPERIKVSHLQLDWHGWLTLEVSFQRDVLRNDDRPNGC